MASVAEIRTMKDRHRPPCPRCTRPMPDASDHITTPSIPTNNPHVHHLVYACCGQQKTIAVRVDGPTAGQVDDPFAHLRNTPTDGGPMTGNTTSSAGGAATGDVHDVETCDAQLDALHDDLTSIDTALDVIDNSIRDAGAATERIEAWLRSKNVDDTTVGGMSQALEMLSPERIKSLIDAIAAAKAGVQTTKDGLQPLREAAGMLQGADGSVLNGR